MLRLHYQLDNHRDYIEQALFNHKPIKSIYQDLCQNFGYIGTALIIYYRIDSWKFIIPAKQTRTSDTKELYDCIYEFFFQYGLTDAEILQMLRIKSFFITEYRFKTIRLDFSLYCRYNVERLQIV